MTSWGESRPDSASADETQWRQTSAGVGKAAACAPQLFDAALVILLNDRHGMDVRGFQMQEALEEREGRKKALGLPETRVQSSAMERRRV